MGRWSRRAFLAAGGLSSARLSANGKGTRLESPITEFDDELTGRKVERLTNPEILFHLPHHHHRFLSRRSDFLLLSGEAAGSRQAYVYDLDRERLTQLTEGPGFHPYSPTMDERERDFYYLQGDELKSASLRGRGETVIFRCPEEWSLSGHLSVSADARWAAVIEIKQGHEEDDPAKQFKGRPRCRLRAIEIERPENNLVLAEERRWLAHPQFRPGRSEVLFAHEGPWDEVDDRIQIVGLDGEKPRSIRLRRGDETIGHEYWSADGSRIYYVHFPNKTLRGATIRSLDPESTAEAVVSPCSAFGWLQNNRDGSVIAGSSRRPSGPNVYVLFARLKREVTLCEHASSSKPYPVAGSERVDHDCAQPETVFSPDSQWVYFVSDKDGRPAIYRTKVEDLVEAT